MYLKIKTGRWDDTVLLNEINGIRGSFVRGPPKFFGVLGTPPPTQKFTFYCIFKKEFSKIWSFRAEIFSKNSSNFQNNSRNFRIVLKIEKTIIFASKLVHNYHIDPNLAKFSLKTPKKCQIFLKTLKFGVLGPSRADFLEFWVPPDPVFLELRCPPFWSRSSPPQKKTISEQ